MELGSNNIDTIRPGFKGWLDVIRGLRHNPVYHHIRRLRTRRTLSVHWYRRNPVVLLFSAMAMTGMVVGLVTAQPTPGPVTVQAVLIQSWQIIFGMTMAICYGWLIQAMYRYVHDILGLLGRNHNPRLRSPVDDDLALASLENREVLAGAFWAHYRALLPALAVVSLADSSYSFYVEYYVAYAPRGMPDWLVTAFVYGANNLGGFLTNSLGALLIGLGLLVLGCNLDNPRLQPVTGALLAILVLPILVGFTPLYFNGFDYWTPGMSVPEARLVLVFTALGIVGVVAVLLFCALKSALVRQFLAWLVPGFVIMLVVVHFLEFIPIYNAYISFQDLLPDGLLFEFIVVLGSAFGCPNSIVSVIPLETYYQLHFTYSRTPYTSEYLWVVWWYFPVLTALQLILAVGLVQFATAAVSQRRRAVE